MNVDSAIEVGRNALMMVIIISAPMLGLGMIVGVAISIFQATTQIQEQTLAFIPKIVAVFVAVIFFGPWMVRLMVDYTRQIILSLPQLIK